mgnify:CR=1 FL=1
MTSINVGQPSPRLQQIQVDGRAFKGVRVRPREVHIRQDSPTLKEHSSEHMSQGRELVSPSACT